MAKIQSNEIVEQMVNDYVAADYPDGIFEFFKEKIEQVNNNIVWCTEEQVEHKFREHASKRRTEHQQQQNRQKIMLGNQKMLVDKWIKTWSNNRPFQKIQLFLNNNNKKISRDQYNAGMSKQDFENQFVKFCGDEILENYVKVANEILPKEATFRQRCFAKAILGTCCAVKFRPESTD